MNFYDVTIGPIEWTKDMCDWQTDKYHKTNHFCCIRRYVKSIHFHKYMRETVKNDFYIFATLTSTMLSQLLLSSGSAVFSSTKLEVYTAFLFRKNRSHRTHRLGATLCGLGRSSESTTETHELVHWCYSAVSQLSCLWAKNVKGQQFKVYQNQHGSNFIIMLQLRLK